MTRSRTLLLMILVLVSCGREGSDSDQAAGEATATETQIDVQMEKARFFASVRIGGSTNSDGTVATESRSFGAGYPIYLSVRASESPKGLVANLVVRAENGEAVYEDRKEVPDSKVVLFEITETSKWSPGTYRAEIALGGEEVAAPTFAIAELPGHVPASPH